MGVTLHSPLNPGAIYEMGEGTLLDFVEGYKTLTDAQYKAMIERDPERWQKIINSGKVLVLKEGVAVKTAAPFVNIRRSDAAAISGIPPGGRRVPSEVPLTPTEGPKAEEEDPATPVVSAPADGGKIIRNQQGEVAPASPHVGRPRKQQ